MQSTMTYLAGALLVPILAGPGLAQSEGEPRPPLAFVFSQTECADWPYVQSVTDFERVEIFDDKKIDAAGAILDQCRFNAEQRLEITQGLVRSTLVHTGYRPQKFRLNRLALHYGDTREAALQYYIDLVTEEAEAMVAAHLAGELDTLASYYIEGGVRTGVGHDRGLCDFIWTYESMTATSVEAPPFLSCDPFPNIDFQWFLENAD